MKKVLIPIALFLAVLFSGAKESAALPGDLLHTFNNPDPAADDYFGRSVAGVGNNVLVGAPGDDTGASGHHSPKYQPNLLQLLADMGMTCLLV